MDDCACEDNHRTPYCACVKLTIEFRAGVRGAAREKPGKRNQESVMNLEDERGSRVVAAQAERRLQPRYHIKIQIELFAEHSAFGIDVVFPDLHRQQ